MVGYHPDERSFGCIHRRTYALALLLQAQDHRSPELSSASRGHTSAFAKILGPCGAGCKGSSPEIGISVLGDGTAYGMRKTFYYTLISDNGLPGLEATYQNHGRPF
jgi:hypothetical protein